MHLHPDIKTIPQKGWHLMSTDTGQLDLSANCINVEKSFSYDHISSIVSSIRKKLND
jgi:hypothetical protein